MALKLDTICERISDNAIFEPSYPDDYNVFKDLVDIRKNNESPKWYFRELVKLPKKWWQKVPRFERTGKIWEPKDGKEFKIIHIDGDK